MAKQLTAKQKAKQDEDRISRLYSQACHGIQISIWDMSKIMQVGREGIAQGLDDEALKAHIRAFVDKIRKN